MDDNEVAAIVEERFNLSVGHRTQRKREEGAIRGLCQVCFLVRLFSSSRYIYI